MRIRLKVCVALSGLEALVAQEMLNLVERHSLLNEPRGAGVAHGVRRVVRDNLLLAVAVEEVGILDGRPPGLASPIAVVKTAASPSFGDGREDQRVTVELAIQVGG